MKLGEHIAMYLKINESVHIWDSSMFELLCKKWRLKSKRYWFTQIEFNAIIDKRLSAQTLRSLAKRNVLNVLEFDNEVFRIYPDEKYMREKVIEAIQKYLKESGNVK